MAKNKTKNKFFLFKVFDTPDNTMIVHKFLENLTFEIFGDSKLTNTSLIDLSTLALTTMENIISPYYAFENNNSKHHSWDCNLMIRYYEYGSQKV